MIHLSNITKKYDHNTVLSNFSLSVNRNEFVCITGPSGAGKTTLLNIIGLIDKPDSGKLEINENSFFSSREKLQLRRTFFGYIFQNFLLLPDKTVKRNLEVVSFDNKSLKLNDMKDALEKVGLDSNYINKKICELSGGEQQKVAIARLLLKPFELVLADEPTGNLDAQSKHDIIDIFLEMKHNGKTIICVTHDEDVANSADRVIELKKYK